MAVSRFDLTALRQGASVALVFAIPFTILGRIVADGDGNSSWTGVLWLLALAGFVLGAGIAAWVQDRGLPMLHGMVCAGGTFLAAQLIFVIVKLVRGSDVHWLSIFFVFTTVLFAGVIGGGLGSAMRKRGIMPRGKVSG